MAIIAGVIALVSAVLHDDVFMLFWYDNFVIVIVDDGDGLAFLMTGVAIEPGDILLKADQISVGMAGSKGVEEICVYQRMLSNRAGMPPWVSNEGGREGKEDNG